MFCIFSLLLILFNCVYCQNYTSYFLGNLNDKVTVPLGGICLMGGATENDSAMKWFLQRANGGDVLVLRSSGSDGYNSYLYNDLGVNINSVETIVFHNALASQEPYIHQRIQQAEAIWIAGGNQWNYIQYWRNSPIDSILRDLIQNKKIVIGGTSAGMAILGKFYFTAENGTVTSTAALQNPYYSNVTIDSLLFINTPFLDDVITDTHFDNPDRKGRLVTFLARIFKDYGVSAKGIACDEYTAICIDTNGLAYVYGDYPNYDDNAYFVQINCDILNPEPESCHPNSPLTWNLNGEAIKVCQIKGNQQGSGYFDLKDWKTGSGGTWYHWSVNNQMLFEIQANPPICSVTTSSKPFFIQDILAFPNPTTGKVLFRVSTNLLTSDFTQNIQVFDMLGEKINLPVRLVSKYEFIIDFSNQQKGVYNVFWNSTHESYVIKVVKE